MDNLTASSGWCFPPPPLFTTFTNQIQVPDFESRFQSFVDSRPPQSLGVPSRPTISGTKNTLNQIQELIQSVQQQSLFLQENHTTMTDAEYSQASSNIIEQQQIVSDLLNAVARPDQLVRVQRAIKKRRKKRCHIRNGTKSKRPVEAQTPFNSPDARPPPEHIPNPVPKAKSNPAQSYLTLINHIIELHRVRSQQAGTVVDTPGILVQLKTLWTEAADRFTLSEPPPKNLDDTQSIETQWERILFGRIKRDTLRVDTEPDLQQLIRLRRCWDAFLVAEDNPCGSSIPVGVVLPTLAELSSDGGPTERESDSDYKCD